MYRICLRTTGRATCGRRSRSRFRRFLSATVNMSRDCFYRRDFAKDPNPMQFKVFVDGAAKPFSTDERTRMHGGVGSRRLTHHWSQVFPKDRPVRIVYEYIPVAGRAGSDPFSDEELRGLERWFREDYCVPINVVRALLERMFSFRIVHYTLTAEPSEIRSFKLTIETNRRMNWSLLASPTYVEHPLRLSKSSDTISNPRTI